MTQQIGSWLLQAFREPWIQYCALPLLAAAVTVALRALSRPDRDKLFEIKLEDWLVGIGLGVTGFLTLATTLYKVSERYSGQLAALASAQASGDTAAGAHVQEQITWLFTYLFGMTVYFGVFLVAMILMALLMSHYGWVVAKDKSPVPKVPFLIAYDLLGLALLVGAIYIMGELK
jgi:hypothetical protein